MKRKTCLVGTALFFVVVLLGCTKSPSETDILTLVHKKYNDGLVTSIEIEKTGSTQKVNNKKVFKYSISLIFIQAGLEYGYISACPERHCCKDIEYNIKLEYLVGKDEWDEWKIYESRSIEYQKVGEYWRPSSISQKDFYKDRI